MYLTPILEFSRDPISDTTPTWVDVTAYLLKADWSVVMSKEGDSTILDASATFVLNNQDRRFEPDYAAGAYYPDVTDMRRFRWRVQNGVGSGTTYAEGIWFVAEWQPEWPDEAIDNVCVVVCADGKAVLANDDLPPLDPPSASSYDDVVSFDEPWGFWGLGDPEGTKARANIVFSKRATVTPGFVGYRKIPHRRGSAYSTRSEAGAVSGPAGIYKNQPKLGVDGLILGSSETATLFDGTTFVKIPLEDDFDEFGGLKQLTLEAWVKWTATPPAQAEQVIAGPENASDLSTFVLRVTNDPAGEFLVRGPNGVAFSAFSGGLVQGTIYHLVGVFNNGLMEFYRDGDFEWRTADGPPSIQAGVSGEFVSIARTQTASGGAPNQLTVMKAAIYTHALTAERILAHYEAGAQRGYALETAGNRILDIATHGLWSEASIQTTGRNVIPVFQTGQGRLEEVEETAHSEGSRTMFFFNRSGDPVYLGFNWPELTAAYGNVQQTFGNAGGGEVPYEDIELTYDNETFNEVTASRVGGELVTATDTTSENQRGRRNNSDWTDVLLADQPQVEGLASDVLDLYKDPAFRPVTITLSGADTTARAAIFTLDIGHLVRVKHRPKGGTAIDRVANIIGRECSLDTETGHLSCALTLGRGFNAALSQWRLGITGFSELNSTAVLA